MTLRLVSDIDPPSTSEIIAASIEDMAKRIDADDFGSVERGIVIADGAHINIEAYGCTSVYEVVGILEAAKATLLADEL